MKSEEIEGILGNSDFVYLLNQNAKDQAILADKLGLSEKQLAHVTNSEPGSGLILFDNVVIPFVDKYPKDTKTYAIMNTKPEESVKQEEIMYERRRKVMETDTIIHNDCLDALKDMPSESVHCCVTSPPYYGLRDYGMDGQVGREATPEQYIRKLTEIFSEVYRVLRADGTCWLNISDTYCGTGSKGGYKDPKNPEGRNGQNVSIVRNVEGCKHKDLIGIPWMLAFALRNSGWYLRNDIVWQKGNAMPESAKDRLTRSYEHIFLLAKSQKYYFDALAISEPIAADTARRYMGGRGSSHKYSGEVPGQAGIQKLNKPRKAGEIKKSDISPVRNCRDVWLINTVPYRGNHFAAYPPKLVERCILAGCPKGGIVLDPFFGSGTTGLVAVRNDRHYIGIELNEEYCVLAGERIGGGYENKAD